MSERDTIPATCPRCGLPMAAKRQRSAGSGFCFADANANGYRTCRVRAEAYRRGIDDGVELAKAYVLASVSSDYYPRPILNWSDVDKAAAAAKGET